MDFEWDTFKAELNENKHGVSFLEACEVFDDDLSSSMVDPDHSIEENRYLIFGRTYNDKCLIVSYTERNDIIRIISVRQMTPRERRAYEQ